MKFVKFHLPFIIWTIFILVLSSIPHLSVKATSFEYEDKIGHLILYFIFSILLLRLLNVYYEDYENRIRKIVILALPISIMFATLKECYQEFIPGRYFEISDLLFDWIGIVVGLLTFVWRFHLFNMLKALAIKVGLLLLFGSYCLAENSIFTDPDIPHKETMIYHYRKAKDEPFIKYENVVKRIKKIEQDFYYFIEMTELKENGKKRELLIIKENLKPVLIKIKYGNKTNKRSYFENKVRAEIKERNHEKEMEIPEDTYDKDTIHYIVRGLNFNLGKTVKFHILTDENGGKLIILPVYAKVVKKEKITTLAGEFNCFKVVGGVRGILSWFIRTKFYFWINETKPHFLVKYETTDGELAELLEIIK